METLILSLVTHAVDHVSSELPSPLSPFFSMLKLPNDGLSSHTVNNYSPSDGILNDPTILACNHALCESETTASDHMRSMRNDIYCPKQKKDSRLSSEVKGRKVVVRGEGRNITNMSIYVST